MAINLFISSKGFKVKPTDKESRILNSILNKIIKSIEEGRNKELYNLSLKYIAKKLKDGHTINTSVKKDNIAILVMDVDSGVTEEAFISDLKRFNLKPNIYYRTFSHNPAEGKIKLRAIFKLDKGYTPKEYTEIYKMVMEFFPYLDTSLRSWRQLIHGTNKEVIYTGEQVTFKPREFAKLNNWKPKKQIEVKKDMRPTPKVAYSGESVESILQNFLAGAPFDYPEAREFYTVLSNFGLQDRLILKDHHTKEKMELNPKFATKGRRPAELFGELRRATNKN